MNKEESLAREKIIEDNTDPSSIHHPHAHPEDPNAVFSEYPNEPRLRDLPFNLKNFARWPLLGLIRGY